MELFGAGGAPITNEKRVANRGRHCIAILTGLAESEIIVNSKVITLIGAVLVGTSFGSHAEIPELLTAVTGSEEATVRAVNEYFLKKHLYIAKRHKIVRVNANLLASVEIFRLSLFDNDSLVAKVTELDIRRRGSSIRWEGEIVDPPFTVEDLVGQGQDLARAKMIHATFFNLSVNAALMCYDEKTGVNSPTYARNGDGACDCQSLDPAANSSVFQAVLASFSVLSFLPNAYKVQLAPPREYRLEVLEMGGPYHILIEIDQDKVISPGPFDDPDNPEMGVKRRQYRDFMGSLGEDPRRAFHRKMQTRPNGRLTTCGSPNSKPGFASRKNDASVGFEQQ